MCLTLNDEGASVARGDQHLKHVNQAAVYQNTRTLIIRKDDLHVLSTMGSLFGATLAARHEIACQRLAIVSSDMDGAMP